MKNIYVADTKKLQSLLYLCLVLSGCVEHSRKSLCVNSLFLDKKLTRYLHKIISKWGQCEKCIDAWIHLIRAKRIEAPGLLPFLTLHHPPTLEGSACPTENSCSSKNCTHLDYFQSELLHNIYMWHTGIVHWNKIKPVLVQLTQHHPVICAPKYYKTQIRTLWLLRSLRRRKICVGGQKLHFTHFRQKNTTT